jgi:hypothetical protein
MTEPREVGWTPRGPFEAAGLRWLVLDDEVTDYYCVVEVPGPAAPREWVLYRSRPDPDDSADDEDDTRVIAFPTLEELEGWIAASDLP